MKPAPRCPVGILATSACVTQKCNSSPFICGSQCICYNAHKYCKAMPWQSVLQLLIQYKRNLPEQLQCFINRVDKLYSNAISKLETELKIFHQFIEEQLYGPSYAKIMHFIDKNNYDLIKCEQLGKIISKMTEKVYTRNSGQQGTICGGKFTVSEMEKVRAWIEQLSKKLQVFCKEKYRVVSRQIADINATQNLRRTNSTLHGKSIFNESQIRSNSKTSTISKISQINQIEVSSKSLIFEKAQGISKLNNLMGTATSNFYQSGSKLKQSSNFAQTRQTQFWNPQSPVKSDLMYPKSINSRIVANASALNHFLIDKVKQYRLIYRASQNNYDVQEFYRRIANYTFKNQGIKIKDKDNNIEHTTLILVKTPFEKIVGGFTKLKWSPKKQANDDQQQEQIEQIKNQSYKQDLGGTSFIFSVDLHERYQLTDPKYAIYCGSKSIGFGKNDIRIVNHCNKHRKNYIAFPSSYNNGAYLPIKKSALTLSGSHDSLHFKVQQWQAFEVVFKQCDGRPENNNKSSINLSRAEIILESNKAGKSKSKNKNI